MKAFKVALTAVLIAPLFTGCLYYNVSLPLDTNLDETQLGSKVGQAQAQSVLWAVAWGDAGTQAAAKEGGITTVRHADQNGLVVFFGAYIRQTTIVYGD
jgi:hypothetical protein